MNSRNIISAVVILVLIVGIFAFINGSMIKDKKEVHKNAEILIVKDEEKVKLSFNEINNLGEEEFMVISKSSGKPAEEHKYTGVPLKNLLDKANINFDEDSQIVVKSIDGFTVASIGSEVLEDDNMYLVYEMDNEALGSKEDGGSGPYQVVIRNDEFAQRWSKYVMEIEINE